VHLIGMGDPNRLLPTRKKVKKSELPRFQGLPQGPDSSSLPP
jgi:hypothetical protein